MNWRNAIAVSTCLLAINGSAQAQYIKDITVVAGSSNSVACPAGYEKNGQDLNQGAGGDYIYACVQKTANRSEALTQISLVNNGKVGPNESFSAGGKWIKRENACGGQLVDVDLNKGAGGAFLWFCKRKDGPDVKCTAPFGCMYVQDLKFTTAAVWQATDAQKCGGDWTPIATTEASNSSAQDLNNLAGGKFIYGCYKYERITN